MIRLLMVDRHAVLRDGLRHILEKSGEFEIDGEAADAASAFELAGRAAPRSRSSIKPRSAANARS